MTEISDGVKVLFELPQRDGRTFFGISQVEIAGVKLMDPSFHSVFAIGSPDGWDYNSFEIVESLRGDGGYVVRTSASAVDSGRLWLRDQYNNDIMRIGKPRTAPILDVTFKFLPVEMEFGSRRFSGFNLSLDFSSPGCGLALMRWLQHWEIGASCEGNRILHQSQISSPFHSMTKDSAWNNSCWKGLELGCGMKNMSMQFNSRCSYHQLFDFIYNENGVMVGYFPEADSIQTASVKNAGENNFFICDIVEFPLAGKGHLAGKNILFSKNRGNIADDIDAKNTWFRINHHLENSYRKQTNIVKSRIMPTELDGMWETVAIDSKLCFGDKNSCVPAEKYLEKIAEEKIPLLKSQGFRRFWTRPFCTSDTSEMLFWNKTMRGRGIMDGDVAFGSCCCVREYKPAKIFGGGEAARSFYQAGRKAGMEIGIWVGNHLSTKAPVLGEHPEWVLKDCSSANPTGGYDNHVLAVVNWNSGAAEWILKDLLEWKKSFGLDFIFFDSLGNLGLKTRNFADDRLRNNFDGLCRFLSELTSNGIQVICEGRSFMGAAYFAISSQGNMHSDDDPLIGQNSLSWFAGHEDMLTGMQLFTEKVKFQDEKSFLDMNFRIIANGGILKTRGCGVNGVFDLYKIFNHVSELMHMRELLPDSQGVLWHAEDGRRLLFSYRPGVFRLDDGRKVAKVTAEGISPYGTMNDIRTDKHDVHVII